MGVTHINRIEHLQRVSLNSIKETYEVFFGTGEGKGTGIEARNASKGGVSIPAYGDAHPDDSNFYCNSKNTRSKDKDAGTWQVEVGYTNVISIPGQLNEDPLSRPAVYNWSSESFDEEYTIDESATPKAVQNTAGMPFENGPTRLQGWPTLQINKNLSVSNWASLAITSYTYKLNSASFDIDGKTIGIGEALMLPIEATKEYENGTNYYAVTFSMALRADWNQYIESLGYHYDDGTGKLLRITLDDGSYPQTPWPLDVNGAKKAAGAAGYEMTFVPYASIAFPVGYFT